MSFLPPSEIARLFRTTNPLPNIAPTWNLAPSQDALVVRRYPSGERHLDVLRWGLLPHFTKDTGRARRPINARAETVGASGVFRGAFAQRRCLVPAMAFFEWRAISRDLRQPYAICARGWEADGLRRAVGRLAWPGRDS